MAGAALLILGFILGVGTGAALGPLLRYVKNYGSTRVLILNPRNHNITLKMVNLAKTNGFLKINGKKTKPPIKEGVRWRWNDNPALILNAANGKAMGMDNAKLTWPTAYECAEVYADAREEKVAKSSQDRSVDYAKVGVVVGAVIGVLVLVTLFMVVKLFNGGPA